MVQLYTDLGMLEHRPPQTHPERPERLAAVLRHLQRTGQIDQFGQGVGRVATDEELLRVHTPAHLAQIAKLTQVGGGQIEADTWLSQGSDLAARLAAGSVISATDSVINRQDPRAFCLVRPPGHHARSEMPMGFCLYGTIAVAAADALARLNLNRILIIDWDVHHGNGTQEMFYENEQVGFFSIHRYPFYPGTGSIHETGTGPGLGTTLNVPVAYGGSRKEYLDQFRTNLETFADRIKPELILLSAGFDAHAEDPVGDLGLENEDFIEMAQSVLSVAQMHSQGRIVSVLEGGYNPARLAGCVGEHLEVMNKA